MGSGRVPKMWDPGEYQKDGIWASAEKVEIRVSTEKVGSERVPEMWDTGEYRKSGIWASTRNVGLVPEKGPGEYWKGGIRVSAEKVGSRRISKKGPREYQKKVGSG